MAQRGGLAGSEDGGHPFACRRQLELADRVNARVEPAQPSATDAVPDRVVREAEIEQVAPRDYTMLPSSKLQRRFAPTRRRRPRAPRPPATRLTRRMKDLIKQALAED